MSWWEVSAVFPAALEDWSHVIDVFGRFGMENTLQTDVPPQVTSCTVDVPGIEDHIEALRGELLLAGAVSVAVQPYQEQNWEDAWKKFFKPRRIGKHFLVRPTWETVDALPSDNVIVLDPGQAFGTGDHATTRMCLELLEAVPVEGRRVLDIGCGSGVLSLGAKLLGAAEVLAIEVDPVAVEVARENASLNHLALTVIASDGIPEPLLEKGEAWDVVMSNIISAAVMRIAHDVASVTLPTGTWIISGVLDTNWPDVLKEAETQGFKLQMRLQEEDWVAASFLR